MPLKIHRTLASRKGDPVAAGIVPPQAYRALSVSDHLVGTLLDGRYRVTGRLGEGAMSTVYKAMHESVGRAVAVKVLKKGLAMDPSSTKRFQREAKAISALSHPNLITVFDFGTTASGQPYQVIEFLQGRSLAQVLNEDGPLPARRAAAIFIQICDAMQHAHEQGIVHRDLKPENIMLIDQGNRKDIVKVVDFGIVKLTEESQLKSQRLTATGEVWGSPRYASPEQCMGRDLDHRTDIYSLGLVLYEVLSGMPAVSGKNIGQIAMKHIKEKPPPIAAVNADAVVPPALERIVFKAIEKEPAQRFDSLAQMKDALEALISSWDGTDSANGLRAVGPAARAATGRDADPAAFENSLIEEVQSAISQKMSAPAAQGGTPAPQADQAQPLRISVDDVIAYKQGRGNTPPASSVRSIRQSTQNAPAVSRQIPWLPIVIAGAVLSLAIVVWAVIAAHNHADEAARPSPAASGKAAPRR